LTQPKRTLLDRLLAAYPLLVAYLVLLTLYAWQTTRIPSPWIFTDELKWSLLSRSIAHTGHPAIRETAAPSSSIYSYFLAPAWWAGATAPGYAAAKYLNAIVMTATLFPAYGLARLVVSRRASLLVAVASAAIPSLALTGVLMPESLAYFWSTLAIYLVGRALLRPSALSIGPAIVAVLIAPSVRGQLQVLTVAAAIAAAVFAATSPRGRATIATWTVAQRVGAIVLALGLLLAADVTVAHHSYEWFIGTHFWHRAFTYGLWAFGALAIGVGVLPVLLALAWAFGAPASTREDRALLGLLVGATAGFGLYTAVKASYLSTTFAIRVEERNLIYLSPLVFLAATRAVLPLRIRLVPLALAAAATGYLIWSTPYHAYEHLYSDAFGLSILQWLNQTWYWTESDLRWLLLAILAIGVLLGLAPRLAPRAGRAIAIATLVLGLATIAWNLTGEVSAARQAVAPAKFQRSLLPIPPDWIDRQTGRARTMFLGKSLSNSYAFWSLEFWNQSIQDVWSVDASAPPPGPTISPDFLSTNGALSPQLPVAWVVSPPEIVIAGDRVERAGGLDLYRVPHPIRMSSFVSGITLDGWMQEESRYVRFAPRPVPGTVTISLSRTAACVDTPARFTFRVSGVRIDDHGQPAPGRLQRIVKAVAPPCKLTLIRFPARAPLRIDAKATSLFKASDGRELSAQVGYSFKPKR
jgi:hypothetical protein